MRCCARGYEHTAVKLAFGACKRVMTEQEAFSAHALLIADTWANPDQFDSLARHARILRRDEKAARTLIAKAER